LQSGAKKIRIGGPVHCIEKKKKKKKKKKDFQVPRETNLLSHRIENSHLLSQQKKPPPHSHSKHTPARAHYSQFSTQRFEGRKFHAFVVLNPHSNRRATSSLSYFISGKGRRRGGATSTISLRTHLFMKVPSIRFHFMVCLLSPSGLGKGRHAVSCGNTTEEKILLGDSWGKGGRGASIFCVLGVALVRGGEQIYHFRTVLAFDWEMAGQKKKKKKKKK